MFIAGQRKRKTAKNFIRLRDAATQLVFPWRSAGSDKDPYSPRGAAFIATKKGNEPQTGTVRLFWLRKDSEPQRLDIFDLAVYEAIISICEAGNISMTLPIIYRVMAGKSKGNNAAIVARINTSILKMLNHNIMIETPAESFSQKNKQLPLLAPAYQYREEKGQLDLKEKPALYEYAQMKKHVITKSAAWNITPYSMTAHGLIVREYFYHMLFMNRAQHAFSIRHDSLYTEAGVLTSPSKTSRRRVRGQLIELLESLQEPLRDINGEIIREPIISAYQEQTKTGKQVIERSTPHRFLIVPALPTS